MKHLLLSALLFASTSTLALATEASEDCLGAIRNSLSLARGQEIRVDGGITQEGMACGFAIRYNEANSGITHQNYRIFDIVPSAAIRYADGTLSPVAPIVLAQLADNTNGTDEFRIKTCNVAKDGIELNYTKRQIFGWHTTDKFSFKILFNNGKISQVNTGNTACFFK